jgi:peptidoglycan/LPS O-acetylase OafA/YrhL
LLIDRGRTLTDRLRSLDALRTIAVVMVIACHWAANYPHDAFARLSDRAGWAGVDLFFVLSGFLVSGLLFREHERYGDVHAGRFLIRRGFKIYPPFYALVIAGLLLTKLIGVHPNRHGLLRELTFTQNYGAGLYGHTWSLAVEEHFYFLLVIAAVVVPRYFRVSRRLVAVAVGSVLVACLIGRAVTYAALDPNEDWWKPVYAPTHLRIDSLLIGVGLAYLMHSQRDALEAWYHRYRYALLAAAAAVLSLLVRVHLHSRWMSTIGLTMIAFAFAVVLLAVLLSDIEHGPFRRVVRVLAFAGPYSYSIYLWHMAVQQVVAHRLLPGRNGELVLVVQLIVAFGVGIIIAKLIEVPMLRTRDRLFPSRSVAVDRTHVAREAAAS